MTYGKGDSLESIDPVIGYLSMRLLEKDKKYKVCERKVIPTDGSQGVSAQFLLKIEAVQKSQIIQ